MAKCRKCGANPQKESVCLTRVNPLGEDGVWECKPDCKTRLRLDEALLQALEPGQCPAIGLAEAVGEFPPAQNPFDLGRTFAQTEREFRKS